MQQFEFVMIIASIVIALGIAELLAGVVRIFRGELKFYWVHSFWIFNLLLLQLQFCWAQFEVRGTQVEWVFADLLALVSPPIVMFLASSLLFPSRSDRCDLAEFYYSNRRPVFGLLAGLMLFFSIADLSTNSAVAVTAQLGSLASVAILFFSPHPRVHALVAPGYAVGLLLFIASFTNELKETAL